MPYKAKSLHLISSTPAGSFWMYDAGYDHTITEKYFNRAYQELKAGDFILVNSDGGGAPTGSMLHVWATGKNEVAFSPMARAFCECAACMKHRVRL